MTTNSIIYADDFARANFSNFSDWTPIIAAAIASFPKNNDFNGDGMGGTIIFSPAPGSAPVANGVYTFLTPAIPGTTQGYGIELNRAVALLGISGAPAANSYGASQLHFAAGLGGVRINYNNFPQSGLLGADGALLQGLSLVGGGAKAGQTTAHGVFFNTACTLRDLTVATFSGDGVNTLADTSGSPVSSSSLSLVENIYAVANGGNGFTTNGSDSNAICFINPKARSNFGWGIYENSFIGCKYVGGYVESNQGGGVWAAGVGASDFFGVYIEGGDALNINQNQTIFGGLLAMSALNAGSLAKIWSANGMGANVVTSADGKSVLGLGSAFNDAKMIVGLKDMNESGGAWPTRVKNFGWGFGFEWAETGLPYFALLNSRSLEANGFYADAALVPDVAACGGVFMRGFFIGNANAGVIYHGVSNAIPTGTAYPVGSIIENSAAVNIGDPVAWKLVKRAGALQWVVASALLS